jgi:conjugative relaxase-like TrwC/TraI family protein
VLSKHDPTSGRLLEGSVRRARMPGFDLMFSVPKSASVLFGIGPSRVQRAILDAQAVAVQSAMRYLEQHACRTRRGAGGYEVVPGEGFVGAAFRHRTSRAGDPQVHTHVLIANATRIQDGTWASLDGRAIYAEARTAGFVHEAVFRAELSNRLGVSWTEAHNGIAEIDGVPRSVIDAFSRRRAEINAQVDAWGGIRRRRGRARRFRRGSARTMRSRPSGWRRSGASGPPGSDWTRRALLRSSDDSAAAGAWMTASSRSSLRAKG